jgi:hypothetical protein
MFRTYLRSRAWPLALGAAVGLCARDSAADPAKDKWNRGVQFCSNVYYKADQLEQSGKLRQARDMFLSGAKAYCFAAVRRDCMARYNQLELEIPSVVPVVTTQDGEPRVDVQVSIDNEPVTGRLDGRSLPLDPGLHEFTFSADGKILATEKIMIVQGQRNRAISIVLRADPSAKKGALGLGEASIDAKASLDSAATERQAPKKREPEVPAPDQALPGPLLDKAPEKPAPERTAPERNAFDDAPFERRAQRGPGGMPYLFGTIGVFGVGGAGLLTYWGRKDNDLLAQCAPHCSQSSVDHIRKLYVAADVSLGVGVAALATSVIWFLASSSKDKSKPQSSYRVDVHPAPSGGFATLSRSF